MANNNKLKAYVRYDGTGRVIAGSLILQRFKPKDGNWKEINANQCCNPVPSTTTTTTTLLTTTTTTNPGYYTWTAYFGINEGAACSETNPTLVYTSGPDFTGSVVYIDTDLTTTLSEGSVLALNSPGGKFTYVINASGEATSPTAC